MKLRLGGGLQTRDRSVRRRKSPGSRGSYRAVVVAVVIAAVLGLAELPFACFMADDLIQLGILEGVSPNTWTGPLELYTLSDGDPEHVRVMKDTGAFPWFFDPQFKVAFCRPLSSGLLALDHAVFGLWPGGYRLHGALWFVALVAGLGLLLRRLLAGSLGALALTLFTISGIHGILSWTATRHIVIAGALGMLALVAHIRWREDGWRPGLALAPAGDEPKTIPRHSEPLAPAATTSLPLPPSASEDTPADRETR